MYFGTMMKQEILKVNHQPIYVKELILRRPNETFKAGLCLCEFSMFTNCEEVAACLHPQEWKYYEKLRFEKRIKSYLMGRLTAKRAIAEYTGEKDLTKILIQSGIFTQPITTYEEKQNIQVSISHSDDFGAAIAFPEAHPMGIDIERINIEQNEAIEREVTVSEIKIIKGLPFSYEIMLTLLWTAKEALSKVLKTGLMTPFKIYEVEKIENHQDSMLSFYKNFAQYKTVSFLIGNNVCSIVYPMKTELSIDIRVINETFKHFR
jgi:4'-phosphopantetheinyl transferase EntD